MTTQQPSTVNRSKANRRCIVLAVIAMGSMTEPSFSQNITNETQISGLNPFTHSVSIPATSDPGTIRFESVKATKVFTKVKSTRNLGYCEDLQFRDPGGSTYCPSRQDDSPAPAYKVTYSYQGQPLTPDEYGNRYFTFQVYFRPEELPPAFRRAVSTGMKRTELATYFDVATSRQTIRTAVIDETHSRFCDGNYMDGFWIQNNPNCRDEIRSKLETVPSEYITVQVNPASSRGQETVAAR
jgi:hypothetical protein